MGELINTVMMLDMQPKGQESCTCGDNHGSEAAREELFVTVLPDFMVILVL